MANEGRSNGISAILAFFLGILTGAIFSLLYTPFAGRETREKIRGVSTDARDKTIEVVHRTKDRARESVSEFVEQSRERIGEARNSVKATVEVGKKTFTEKKAELADAFSHIGSNDDNSNIETSEEEVVS